MSHKPRKDFLIAVSGSADFYKTVSEKERAMLHAAALRNEGEEPLYLKNPLTGTANYYAEHHHGLLRSLMPHSPSIKWELISSLAEYLIDHPEAANTLLESAREKELVNRGRSLDMDFEEDLFLKHDEDICSMGEDLDNFDFMRGLPDNVFTRDLSPLKEQTDMAERITKILADHAVETKADDIGFELGGFLDESTLIDWADICEFHYGGPRFGVFGLPKSVTKTFDAAAAVMRNWQDLKIDAKGRERHGFSIGKGAGRFGFIEGAFVRQKLQP